MTTAVPTPDDVLESINTIGPPGTPVTTPEVADGFDCTQRTIYNRLESLVDDGFLQTKKVGANSRVWWRPANTDPAGSEALWGREQVCTHPIFDSELVGVIVWDSDVTIRDANDAFLDMAGLAYEDALGTSWRELTPEEFYPAGEQHISEVEESGGGVPYEKQYYRADGSRWWGLFESRRLNDDDYVEFVIEITERKQQERYDKFLLTLSDRVRTLESQDEIGTVCTRLLAEELSLDRAYFVRFDPAEREALIGPEYHGTDLDPVSGLYPFSAFPEAIQQIQHETPVYDDVANDSTLPDAEKQALLALDFGAWIGAPIRREAEKTDWALYAVTSEAHDWTEAEVSLVEEVAERTWTTVERARAEQRLKESNQSLERLNDVSRELIDADPETISTRVAELTVDVLGVEYAALWRYDQRSGDIELASEHSIPETDSSAVRSSEVSREHVWETFIGGDIDVENALDITDGEPWPSRLGSRTFIPLGRHGVIFAGSVHSETFDEQLVDLVKMVASTVETAWNRAESEQELERHNEELTRLDRLNALIRGIDQALVEAETSGEIRETICERLADSELYEFAWIGEFDVDSDGVRPRAWAGVDSSTLGELTTATDGTESEQDLFSTAVRTREVQVVADIATDAQTVPWREAALKRGARSCLAIPLVYDESIYGVLVVYGGTPQRDERDTDVLAELGGTIAHAINAVETRETLRTDSVAELTLRTTGATMPLCRLARQLECPIEFEGYVPGADNATVFFTLSDRATADVLAVDTKRFPLGDLECLVDSENGDALFRAHVTEPTLASLVVEGNAVVRSLSIDPSAATIVVDVFQADRVGAFLDQLQRAVPDIELLARRTQSRPLETRQTFRRTFEERLTSRQQEVLHTAYRSGFFRSPRVQTGKELATTLGISPATFTHHLRNAERQLCEMVFDST